MDKVNRVFFHELGHFVAREINQKYFNGTGSKEFLIYPCDQDPHEFCGHIVPNVPNGVYMTKPPPLIRLAEHLTSLFYGCVFQAYYNQTDLKDCFNKYGNDDMNSWYTSLNENNLSHINKNIANIEKEYFNSLLKERTLDDFMTLDPENYLIENGEKRYYVDIQKLREDTMDLVKKHYIVYNELIQQYNKMINGNIR